jgi:hypothetical protein
MFKLTIIAVLLGLAASMGNNVEGYKYGYTTSPDFKEFFKMMFGFKFEFGWYSHHHSHDNPSTKDADSGPWTQSVKGEVSIYTVAKVSLDFTFLNAYMVNYGFSLYPFNFVPIGLMFQWDRVTKDNDDMRLYMAPYYNLQLLYGKTSVKDNAATWGTSVYDWFFNDATKPDGFFWPMTPSKKLSGGIFQSFGFDAATEYVNSSDLFWKTYYLQAMIKNAIGPNIYGKHEFTRIYLIGEPAPKPTA